jgi:transcriptional regulator
MYIPHANEEKRIPVLHELIRAEPLAALVTLTSTGLVATHLPMVLESAPDTLGVLRGHVSRANPQWHEHNFAVDALAIFSGPQHYITPTWYPGTYEHGKEVPTWNYVVVHAYGPLQIIHDEQWLRAHLEQLTAQSETNTVQSEVGVSVAPWKLSDAPADFIRTLLNGIVGFELPIHRLQGKWKVSQNRTPGEKQGVITGLTALDTPASLIMKNLVAEHS